jgi:hypothetical protein
MSNQLLEEEKLTSMLRTNLGHVCWMNKRYTCILWWILLPWICPLPLGEWGEITSITKVWMEMHCNRSWGITEIIHPCGWNLYSLFDVCPYFYFISIVGTSLSNRCVVLNTWLNKSHGIRWPLKVQDVYEKTIMILQNEERFRDLEGHPPQLKL